MTAKGRKSEWFIAIVLAIGLAALLVGAAWLMALEAVFGEGGETGSPAEGFWAWFGNWGYLLPVVGSGLTLLVGIAFGRVKWVLITGATVLAMDLLFLVLREALPG